MTSETPPPVPDERRDKPEPRRRDRLVLLLAIAAWILAAGLVIFGVTQLTRAAQLRETTNEVSSDIERLGTEAQRFDEQAETASAEAEDLEAGTLELGEGTAEITRSTATSLRSYNRMVADFTRAIEAYNAGDISGSRAIIEQDVTAALEELEVALTREQTRLRSMKAAMARIVEVLDA